MTISTSGTRCRLWLLALLGGVLAADAQVPSRPERAVEGRTILSAALPAAALTFTTEFRYAGGQRFELYGVADAEQHFFVDAGPGGDIRRLYWVQFERYLPNNTHTYQYPEVPVARIGSLPFVYDTRLYTDFAALKPRADSDSGMMRALLAKAGFSLPTAAARSRLVHLAPDRRSELMIIYLESVPAASLPPGIANAAAADTDHPAWTGRTLEGARRGIAIAPRAAP